MVRVRFWARLLTSRTTNEILFLILLECILQVVYWNTTNKDRSAHFLMWGACNYFNYIFNFEAEILDRCHDKWIFVRNILYRFFFLQLHSKFVRNLVENVVVEGQSSNLNILLRGLTCWDEVPCKAIASLKAFSAACFIYVMFRTLLVTWGFLRGPKSVFSYQTQLGTYSHR